MKLETMLEPTSLLIYFILMGSIISVFYFSLLYCIGGMLLRMLKMFNLMLREANMRPEVCNISETDVLLSTINSPSADSRKLLQRSLNGNTELLFTNCHESKQAGQENLCLSMTSGAENAPALPFAISNESNILSRSTMQIMIKSATDIKQQPILRRNQEVQTYDLREMQEILIEEAKERQKKARLQLEFNHTVAKSKTKLKDVKANIDVDIKHLENEYDLLGDRRQQIWDAIQKLKNQRMLSAEIKKMEKRKQEMEIKELECKNEYEILSLECDRMMNICATYTFQCPVYERLHDLEQKYADIKIEHRFKNTEQIEELREAGMNEFRIHKHSARIVNAQNFSAGASIKHRPKLECLSFPQPLHKSCESYDNNYPSTEYAKSSSVNQNRQFNKEVSKIDNGLDKTSLRRTLMKKFFHRIPRVSGNKVTNYQYMEHIPDTSQKSESFRVGTEYHSILSLKPFATNIRSDSDIAYNSDTNNETSQNRPSSTPDWSLPLVRSTEEECKATVEQPEDPQKSSDDVLVFKSNIIESEHEGSDISLRTESVRSTRSSGISSERSSSTSQRLNLFGNY